MKSLKIAFIASEVSPFAKVGGLADVAGSLPFALKGLGADIKVFLPYYRQAKSGEFGIELVRKDLAVKLGINNFIFSLHQAKKEGVDFYFIEKDEFFDREFIYGTPSGDYPDNAIRFAFFAKAVLKGLEAINFKPDIIHCNDWQSALIPFYLKHKLENFEFFRNTKILFTIHNLSYQGVFDKDVMPKIDIGSEFFTFDALEFYGKLNFMKAGILYSEAVSTVSKGYAQEILTNEYGCGLDGLLNMRQKDLYGILNGVDYSDWSPSIDKFIKVRYDKVSMRNKVICKIDLIRQMKLKISENTPLLGVISRLADQKGIDIIADSANEILKLGCGLVILGTGDKKYQDLLTGLAKKHPKTIAVKIAFDNPIAHKIEAGCDMFLMPSRFEPCGLNQMYSLRYGTIPVVRAVGGLDDTIVDYTQDKKSGNGFKFNQANANDFISALKRALFVYKNKKEWANLMIRAMGLDFSWRHSAKEYIRIYNIIKSNTR